MLADISERIGIVTGPAAPDLSTDGQALQSRLRERDIGVSATNWRDPTIEWSAFDRLLVRSCWDYYEEPTAFTNWLDMIEEQDVILHNSPEVIRWNMHKFYLRDLAEIGCPIPPTAYVTSEDEALSSLLDRRGWTDAVVKPAIGTSSSGVWRVRSPVSSAEERRFRRQLGDGEVIVQEFIPQISEGERSLVFFRGTFSHANNNVPKVGEFRAHHSFGSTSEPYTPSEQVKSTARSILTAAAERLSVDVAELLYARVDGIERNDEFVLLELELIEPHLGLSVAPEALDRFVNEITEACRSSGASAVTEP